MAVKKHGKNNIKMFSKNILNLLLDKNSKKSNTISEIGNNISVITDKNRVF